MSVSASAKPVERHNDMLRREAKTHHEIGTFESYDVDQDGYLGSKEAQTLLQDMDVDPVMWHAYAGRKDGLFTRLAYERLVDDLKVFRQADKDASDHLDSKEVEDLETEAGIPKNIFNWKSFDVDNDNKLSKAEFLSAGPAAAHATAQSLAGSSLLLTDDNETLTDKEQADKEWKEEEDAGAEADGWAWSNGADGSAATIDLGMKEGEEHLYHDYDEYYHHTSEDEKGLSLLEEHDDYDKDLDDLPDTPEDDDDDDDDEEGDSLLEEDLDDEEKQHLEDIMNDDLDVNVEDEKKVASELFQAFDSDNNGVLDDSEIKQVLERAGLPNFDWHAYDHNKDGSLTQAEFYAMGSDADNKDNPDLMDGILNQLYDEDPDGSDSFAETESAKSDDAEDHDSVTDDNDDSSLTSDSSSEPVSSDSETVGSQSSSMNEAKTSEPGEASRSTEDKEDLQVFQAADTNGDSMLSGDEIAAFLKQAGKEDFQWKTYDADNDGKLNKEEFSAASASFNGRDDPDDTSEEDKDANQDSTAS